MKPAPMGNSAALMSARLEAILSTNAINILFLVIYALAVFLMFVLGFYTEWIKNPENKYVQWFLPLARGTGYSLNLNTPLILLLSSRLLLTTLHRSPLANVLPLDAAFPDLHIVVGYVIAISVIFHASFHMTWIIIGNGWAPGIFGFTFSVVTGFTLFTVMAVIVLVTRSFVKNRNFRIFHVVHVGGAFIFFVLLVFHGSFNQVPETYKWITPAVIIYVADRIIRRVKASSVALNLTADNAALHGDILVLRVPRPFKFHAGQFAEIQVPTINLEWHPFTIASAPHEEETTFFIKNVGDWTGKLSDKMRARLEGEKHEPLRVMVRGPYGAPAQHVEGYERVVLVSGGVGATPFAAICKDLHHKNVTQNMPNLRRMVSDIENVTLARYDERVRTAVSTLYGIDSVNALQTAEEAEQKSVYVTNMLNLTAEVENASAPSSRAPSMDVNGGPDVLDAPPPVEEDVEFEDENIEFKKEDVEFKDENVDSTSTEGPSETQEDDLKAYNSEDADRIFAEKAASINARRMRLPAEDEDTVLKRLSTAAQMQQTTRQKLARMYEGKAKLLAFLHTTRVQFFLILILLGRMTVLAVGDILTKQVDDLSKLTPGTVPLVLSPNTGMWVFYTDLTLDGVFAVILFLTIGLEISYMGSRYLNSKGRCIDLFGFVPLTLASLGLAIAAVVRERASKAEMVIHYAIILPLLLVLLVARLDRSVRLRSLLTKSKPPRKESKVPDVDFVWTTRDENDDNWLREELSPLAGGTELRLHRYVTRTKEVDVETAADILTSAKAGRPEWDETFQKIAASSPSRSVIGVFFCGPKPMGAAVQAALRRAEAASHLRAAYLSRTPEKILLEDLGIPRGFIVKKLQKRGCSIRFVFREENFS
eukprot:GFKZ01004656.1.p1 GENE.GFKZ01004656.1~~GFKZ01004656.1.p1  ORF type:complete len:877 (+),score=134.84 GFKZ01004656.1:157-2787(+)